MDECKCTFHQNMVGDGCKFCNPQHYISQLEEQTRDDEAEIARLTEERDFHAKRADEFRDENTRLTAALEHIREMGKWNNPSWRVMVSAAENAVAGNPGGKGKSRIERLTAALEPRPIAEAPKDRLILAYCHHASDPYYLGEGKLTDYGAHCESWAFVQDGWHVMEWFPSDTEGDWETGYYTIPGGWFRFGSQGEEVGNPIAWMELPEAPALQGEGE